MSLRAVRSAAGRRGLSIAFVADTHLHADFVTGAVDLAAGGARVLASAAGGRLFPHTGLRDGDEVDLGGLTLRALGTPGHTDEHLSFLLLDGRRPLGVFTGGSLIVGSAARTDLVDPDRTEELARAQWRSLQRLVTLPDEVLVWPTHGPGSFCSAPPGAARSSSIGGEKVGNALLNAGGEDAFVSALLAGLGALPGVLPAPRRGQPARPATGSVRTCAGRADGRPGGRRRRGSAPCSSTSGRSRRSPLAHIPGAVSILLRGAFATWLGWTTHPGTPLVFVRDAEQDAEEIVWQALKIGFEQLGRRARLGHACLALRRAAGQQHQPALRRCARGPHGHRRPAAQRVRRRSRPGGQQRGAGPARRRRHAAGG
ncbi:MAG: MBL fold metallo-hydrolase [Geodermatophilaceae bacterium]